MVDLAGHAGGKFGKKVKTGTADVLIPKFFPDGLLIVHAGGKAGLFSAVLGGWARGAIGSSPVTREVKQ